MRSSKVRFRRLQWRRRRNYKHIKRAGKSVSEIVKTVNEICVTEPRASFAKDNLGGIVIRLLDYDNTSGIVVKRGTFPPQSLAGRNITGVEFQDSYFQSTALGQAKLIRSQFVQCEFEGLEFGQGTHIEEAVLDDCDCRSAIPPDSDTPVFAPAQVRQVLKRASLSPRVPPQFSRSLHRLTRTWSSSGTCWGCDAVNWSE